MTALFRLKDAGLSLLILGVFFCSRSEAVSETSDVNAAIGLTEAASRFLSSASSALETKREKEEDRDEDEEDDKEDDEDGTQAENEGIESDKNEVDEEKGDYDDVDEEKGDNDEGNEDGNSDKDTDGKTKKKKKKKGKVKWYKSKAEKLEVKRSICGIAEAKKKSCKRKYKKVKKKCKADNKKAMPEANTAELNNALRKCLGLDKEKDNELYEGVEYERDPLALANDEAGIAEKMAQVQAELDKRNAKVQKAFEQRGQAIDTMVEELQTARKPVAEQFPETLKKMGAVKEGIGILVESAKNVAHTSKEAADATAEELYGSDRVRLDPLDDSLSILEQTGGMLFGDERPRGLKDVKQDANGEIDEDLNQDIKSDELPSDDNEHEDGKGRGGGSGNGNNGGDKGNEGGVESDEVDDRTQEQKAEIGKVQIILEREVFVNKGPQAAWDELDKDGDGTLSKQELTDGLKRSGKLPASDVETLVDAVYDSLDTDGNGTIEKSEFYEAFAESKADPVEWRKQNSEVASNDDAVSSFLGLKSKKVNARPHQGVRSVLSF